MLKVAVLMLVCALLLSACPLVVADAAKGFLFVNGFSVSREEFVSKLEQVPVERNSTYGQATVPAAEWLIKQIIAEQIVRQMAEKHNCLATDQEINEKLTYLKKNGNFAAQLKDTGMTEAEWKRQMVIQQSVSNLLARTVVIRDVDLKKRYDAELKKKPSPFVRPEACHISVIICKKKDKIDKAYRMLRSGQDFGSVAYQLSEDKNTAPYQGQVGWLQMDMNIVPMPIRKATFACVVGKHTQPVYVQDKSDKAWVIIKVDQKRAKVVQTFDSTKTLIREQMSLERADRKRFDQEVKDFIAESKIVINDERYSSIPGTIRGSEVADLAAGEVEASVESGE